MSKFIKLHENGKICIIDKESICAVQPNFDDDISFKSVIYFKNVPGKVRYMDNPGGSAAASYTEIYVDESTEQIWSILNQY